MALLKRRHSLCRSLSSCFPAFGYEIVPSPNAVGRILPSALDQLGFFQPVKGRVKGALFERKVSAASLVHFLHNLVAVHRLAQQKRQQQCIRISLEQLLLLHEINQMRSSALVYFLRALRSTGTISC